MTAASAEQKATGDSAFTHLFVQACEEIVEMQRTMREKDSSRYPTFMCLRPLKIFARMCELWESNFPDAPPPRISDAENYSSFPIGPLSEV